MADSNTPMYLFLRSFCSETCHFPQSPFQLTPLYPLRLSDRTLLFAQFCESVHRLRFPRRLFSPSPSLWSIFSVGPAFLITRCIRINSPFSFLAAYHRS